MLIVGAGATGALAATVLAQAGLDVLCLEQGAWVEPGDHPHYSSDWTWQRRTNWSSDVNKRHHPDDYPVETNSSQVLMWNGVGGSTNVYSAIWPRFRPSDFRKGDEHIGRQVADFLRGPRAFLRKGRSAHRHERPRWRPRHAAARPVPHGAVVPHPAPRVGSPRPSTSSGGIGGPLRPALSRRTMTRYQACNGCGICNGCRAVR